MTHDVFISYSRKDFDEVNAFVQILQKCIPQLSCWFDLNGIESGDEFTGKIISAIKKSSYILFMFSDNAIESKWTQKEVMYANNIGKKIVPILLKGASLKDDDWFLFEFGRIDCIDSTDPRQVNKLIDNLSAWTGKKSIWPDSEASRQAIGVKEYTYTSAKSSIVLAPEIKIYKVGDYYNENGKEGVVFEVDKTGRHGKIVGMRQTKTGCMWCTKEEYNKQISTNATDKHNGMNNMQEIMGISNWRKKYPAFAWCAEQGSGWYLPAIEELKKFTLDDSVHDAVNRILIEKGGDLLCAKGYYGVFYWSSSENKITKSCAWYVGMYNGHPGNYSKILNNYVRAVSVF